MGHEIHPASSPAHRRLANPSSPFSALRKTSLPPREESDLSWKALMHRHQFLLLMLALLLFLCTVYLYFAITLGTSNPCAGLTGAEKEICNLSGRDKGRRVGARALLTDPNAWRRSRKDLRIGICTDAGDDGFSCKVLKAGKRISSPGAQCDLVFGQVRGSLNHERFALEASKLVKKGGILVVAPADVSKSMQKLNWSFVGRDRDKYQVWRAPQ